jgi:hypothetical protein
MLSRIQALENQNSQLRLAAVKREQVLMQSKRFIESNLSRWAPPGQAGQGGEEGGEDDGSGYPPSNMNGTE